MEKNEKMIIIGKTCSGKDYLLKYLIEKKLKYSPKITTRPIRKNERNGIDYYYMNNNEFISLIKNNEMKVHQRFIINDNDWYYGITNNNFNCNQLFIMTPYEISLLSKEDLDKSCIVYLDISDDTRRERLLIRKDSNDSIERRIMSDNFDFRDFERYDIRVTDSNFDPKMIWDLMF